MWARMGEWDGNSMADLHGALRRYLDARNSSLTAARQTLKVNELDARAILFIADRPGIRPGELRDYLGVTSAGVTTLVDRLVERGIVRRDVDETDRRVTHITLTIDLRSEPWSALTQFDHEFERAVTARNDSDSARFSELLDSLTAQVRSEGS